MSPNKKASRRSMRLNIWRALLCASDQEIHDGMTFYEGAHGLCKLIARVYKLTVEQVAGIYAALSPLNNWDTNVANIFDILRLGDQAKVNTPHANKLKALQIASGADPLDVLKGNKVRAFYRAIADPSVRDAIPVDRHLFCLALGLKITDNNLLSRIIGSKSLYTRVESIYLELGEREGIGNRLAAIAWFVQRRVESGQALLPHPDSPYCCNRPMYSFGKKPRRFYCSTCNDLRLVPYSGVMRRFVRPPIAYLDGYPITQSRDPHDGRLGRKRIVLGKSHPFANKAGWQYLSRYLVMRHTGERLRPDEHVDHIDLDKTNDQLDLSNYRVMLAERHGRHHVYLAELAGGRAADGRFQVYDRPIDLSKFVPF